MTLCVLRSKHKANYSRYALGLRAAPFPEERAILGATHGKMYMEVLRCCVFNTSQCVQGMRGVSVWAQNV